MTDSPTPQQALILWCLLGRGGAALQGTLVPAVKAADREALIAGRYVTVEKQARALRLTVTDKGWNWAGTHMDAALPPTFRVLQDWLGRIGGDLARSGRPLAELVGPVADEPPAEKPPSRRKAVVGPPTVKGSTAAKGAKAAGAKATTKPKTSGIAEKTAGSRKSARPKKSLSPEKLRARIEKAYLTLTGGERAHPVRLSALRAELADLDRATVDRGLAAILNKDKTARLSKFSDPRSLDEAERAAAFSPAGEPFHILRIQT